MGFLLFLLLLLLGFPIPHVLFKNLIRLVVFPVDDHGLLGGGPLDLLDAPPDGLVQLVLLLGNGEGLLQVVIVPGPDPFLPDLALILLVDFGIVVAHEFLILLCGVLPFFLFALVLLLLFVLLLVAETLFEGLGPGCGLRF